MGEHVNREDLIALGKAAFNERRFEEAAAYLQQAAQSGQADAGTLALLGASYSFAGRHAAAVAAFERAVEIQPQSAQAHHNLAVAFEQANRPDDAVVQYREAVRLDPGHTASVKSLQRLAPEPAAPPAPEPKAKPKRKPRRWGRSAKRLALGALGVVIVVAAAGAGIGASWMFSRTARERRAEERAQECRRNLEALTRAVLDYAGAHGDRLPSSDAWTSAVMAYPGAGQEARLDCPSDPRSQPGYAMNAVLSDMPLDEIGAPERTILLYEVRRGRPVRRHRGTAFYGFADGHVERLSEAPDHLWRLKRAGEPGAVNPGQRPLPPPAPEPGPETPDSEGTGAGDDIAPPVSP